ncbi:hypothetical protein J41TS12_23380 [Paenibacillus antibioticophila]|uniref:Uncharacterized protein n=1 Tax=Paenibacillus antibioticophila TaxID=1274374 RepID=A0A919XVN8_9BACL|nr:hypothetical protein J41TS12_23380 [Paenibacillus antibioticophila]
MGLASYWRAKVSFFTKSGFVRRMKILREVISLNRDGDEHEQNKVGQEERIRFGAMRNAGESS